MGDLREDPVEDSGWAIEGGGISGGKGGIFAGISRDIWMGVSLGDPRGFSRDDRELWGGFRV